MSKMKKRILSVALATAMAASLFAGCGPEEEKKAVGEYITVEGLESSFKKNVTLPVTDEKVELIVWESLLGPDEFIVEAGKWFTKLYPNISIKFINVESTESQSKMSLDGPAGNGADLFAAPHDKCGVLALSNLALPVPEAEVEYVKNNCTEAAFQGAQLNKKDGTVTTYGYPVSVETFALFYNKDLIKEEEIPKNMGDMVTYIKEYKADSSKKAEPFLFDSGNAYYGSMFFSTPENHLYGPNGSDIKKTYFNTEAAVKQIEENFIPLSEAIGIDSGDMAFKNNDSMFAAGKCVMNVSGAWNIKTYEEDGVNFGITSIPSLVGSENPPVNFMGVRCMYVSAYSKHQNEAMVFAEFLMTKEMQQLRCEITSTMPARDDVLSTIRDEKVKGYMEGLNKQLQSSYPMPNMAEASKYWSPFETAMQNIWNGKVTDVAGELNKADETATLK